MQAKHPPEPSLYHIMPKVSNEVSDAAAPESAKRQAQRFSKQIFRDLPDAACEKSEGPLRFFAADSCIGLKTADGMSAPMRPHFCKRIKNCPAARLNLQPGYRRLHGAGAGFITVYYLLCKLTPAYADTVLFQQLFAAR